MRTRPVVLLVVGLLVATPATAFVAPTPNSAPASSVAAGDGPSFVGAYPNPVADGDVGEYLLLAFPEPTEVSNWTLVDGETTIAFPNRTVRGPVLVSSDSAPARALYANASPTARQTNSPGDGPVTVVEAPGLGLANGGDTVELRNDSGATVSTLSYRDAPEGEAYRDDAFHPLGATDHPASTTRNVSSRTFLTPDTAVPLAPIRCAEDRIVLAGYTFASDRVARALARAAARGVDVRVLVDDAPVGGITRRQVRILDDLAARGVAVRALGGPRARYDHHHAKYLVADDEAVVLTENWKPSGTGGRANRGWGVVLRDGDVATDLLAVFDADWRAPDAQPWTAVADDVAVEPAAAANATYPTNTLPRNVTVDAVTVVTAPDNAERVLAQKLRNATERIAVLQMTASRDGVLVRETIAAARRGVEVRVLLSSAWYAREDNAALVDALNALADREDLPIEARLVDPDGRFQKVHAKGVVVDDAVVLGSINWNDHSLRENREVAVVLEGDAVAAYYADAFEADWEGGSDPRVPLWLGALAGIALVICLVVLRERIDVASGRD